MSLSCFNLSNFIPRLKSTPKRTLTTEEFINEVPKVELHVHFDGAYDLSLIYAANEPLPGHLSMAAFVERCQCQGQRSLAAMFKSFDAFTDLVKNDFDLIEKLARAFVGSQARQNVVYTEMRFNPQLLGDDLDKVMISVRTGLVAGCQEYGVVVNQILCGLDLKPEWSVEVVELAKRYRYKPGKCGVVGVDIAGGEGHFQPHDPHQQAVDLAKSYGIPITMHAGEVGGPENILRSINELGAERIGHGYALAAVLADGGEGGELAEVIRQRRVHLEICPTSSYETGGWAGDAAVQRKWEEHPLRTFVDAGVRVALNSDDPTVFATTISNEYRIALDHIGLTQREVVSTIQAAVDASFCSVKEKQRCRRKLEQFVRTIHFE